MGEDGRVSMCNQCLESGTGCKPLARQQLQRIGISHLVPASPARAGDRTSGEASNALQTHQTPHICRTSDLLFT